YSRICVMAPRWPVRPDAASLGWSPICTISRISKRGSAMPQVSQPLAEAIREGWLGEVEGLQVSLAGANDKLRQIDSTLQRHTTVTQVGLPTFTRIAGRTPPKPAE